MHMPPNISTNHILFLNTFSRQIGICAWQHVLQTIIFVWVNKVWVGGNSIILILKSLTLADQAWRSGGTAGSYCPKLLVARGVRRRHGLCLYATPTWRLVRAHVAYEVKGNSWVVAHQTWTKEYPRSKSWLRHWLPSFSCSSSPLLVYFGSKISALL